MNDENEDYLHTSRPRSRPQQRCWTFNLRKSRLLLKNAKMLITFLILLLQYPSNIQADQSNIVKEFSDEFAWMDNDIPQFNNLVIDKNTGRIFIGAVNKLYQLLPDLTLKVNAITGPKEDSPLCSVLPDCPNNVEKKLTNNINKALVIDYAESRIIECGSLFQGVCTVRNLRNISDIENRVREPVVANNATASTVAFIAPGPPNPPITQVMYVGVTWTGNGPYRSEVPAASSRSLDSGTLFQIAETAVTTGKKIWIYILRKGGVLLNQMLLLFLNF